MLEDIKNKKIDVILIKDLSRLGRNYIETGNFVEVVFPVMGVSVISVDENYERRQTMKKILIIEDEKIIRNELKSLLENSGYEVLIIEKFDNVKENIKNMKFDLILMDINLPNKNGEILLKEIRKESNVPIIMVTSRVGEVDEVLSISYGADDYITKPYNPTILLLRIQNIFKRMDNNMDDLFYDNISVNPQKGILKQGEKVLELTKNEMIIFTYLLSNRGRIVTRDDLMTDLWNNNEFINDNALTVNISRLRNKLQNFGLENRIETRKGQGYKLL